MKVRSRTRNKNVRIVNKWDNYTHKILQFGSEHEVIRMKTYRHTQLKKKTLPHQIHVVLIAITGFQAYNSHMSAENYSDGCGNFKSEGTAYLYIYGSDFTYNA